jgi:hypothetical protein
MRRRCGIEVVFFLHGVREVEVGRRPRRGRRATRVRWARQGVEISYGRFLMTVICANSAGGGGDNFDSRSSC